MIILLLIIIILVVLYFSYKSTSYNYFTPQHGFPYPYTNYPIHYLPAYYYSLDVLNYDNGNNLSSTKIGFTNETNYTIMFTRKTDDKKTGQTIISLGPRKSSAPIDVPVPSLIEVRDKNSKLLNSFPLNMRNLVTQITLTKEEKLKSF